LIGVDKPASDKPASSKRSRDLLGWEPIRPGLLDDLEQGHYFQQPQAVTS
jgi:hypothetical protein